MSELTDEQREALAKNLDALSDQGMIFIYNDRDAGKPCELASIEVDDHEGDDLEGGLALRIAIRFLFHEDQDGDLDHSETLFLEEGDELYEALINEDPSNIEFDELELDGAVLDATGQSPREWLSEEGNIRRLRLDCRNHDYKELRALMHAHDAGPVVDLNLGISGDASLVEKTSPHDDSLEYRVDSPALEWFRGLSRFLFGGELDESTRSVTAKGPDGQEVTLPALETPEDVERAMTPGLMANLLYVNVHRLAARDVLASALEASVRCLPEDWAAPESEGFDQPENRVLERFFNDLASDARDAARDEAANLDALGQTFGWKPFQTSRFMDAAKEIVVMERFADMAHYSPSDGIFKDSIVSVSRDIDEIFSAIMMDDIATQGFFEKESAGLRNVFVREEVVDLICESIRAYEKGVAPAGNPVIGEIVERKEYLLAGDMPDTPDDGPIPQAPYQQSYFESLAASGVDVSNTAAVREEAVEAAYTEAIARTALGENDSPSHGVLDCSIQVADSLPGEAIEQFRSLRPDRRRTIEQEKEVSLDAPGLD